MAEAGTVSMDGNDTGELLAKVLIAQELIDERQLAYAKRVRAKLSEPMTLLNTMLELEYFSSDELNEALRKAKFDIPIGALLVELGDISQRELGLALRQQSQTRPRKKLGEVLLEQRYLKESRLLAVLANQLGFPHIEPDYERIDKDLLAQFPSKFCNDLRFIPLRMDSTILTVACIDPMDTNIDVMVSRLVSCQRVITAICSRGKLEESLRQHSNAANPIAPPPARAESRYIHLVDELLADAFADDVSDIHIEPQANRMRVRMRRDSTIWPHSELSKEDARPLIARLKVMAGADIAERRRHQDGKFEFIDPKTGQSVDVRCSFYVSMHGETAVLRLLGRGTTLLNIEQSGMYPGVMEKFKFEALDLPNGLVLITGPTGSGKTTTLYGCIDYLNNDETSIITAEEPVEYQVDGITQCSLNPKINVTFEETLRHMVRQDPDVIVLGEIRDQPSAEAAIQAALTGHKVLSTFHTEDSVGGLLRLMNMNIETFLISSTVVSVVAQRLLRKLCRECATPQLPSLMQLRRLGMTETDAKKAEFLVPNGCEYCQFSGYRGRVAVYELLVLNERVKEAILRNRPSYEIRDISIKDSGMVTLIEDGLAKASEGLTSVEEVLRMLPLLNKPRPLPEIMRLVKNYNG